MHVPVMTLRLQHNSGEVEEFELAKYGGSEYFSWGNPGLHAGVWKFVVRPNGDVYLFERSLGYAMKVSLHRSGQWQLAWVYENITKDPLVLAAVEARDSRFVDVWDRPTNDSLPHLTAYTIFTTGRDLTAWGTGESDDEVKWLPPPSGDELALFNIVFFKSSGQVIDLKGFVPVAAIPMKTDEALLVLAGRKAPDAEEVETLAKFREKILTDAEKAGVSDSNLVDSRVLLHRKNDDGGRFALDLAYRPRKDIVTH